MVSQLALRQPSFADRIQVLKLWFEECKNDDDLVLRPALAKLFVRKGLCRDVETALTLIETRFSSITGDKIITLSDLIRCFAP
jgi:hypothetical protein